MGKDGAARQAGELAESVARFARCAGGATPMITVLI
jgi:hypothetical protein